MKDISKMKKLLCSCEEPLQNYGGIYFCSTCKICKNCNSYDIYKLYEKAHQKREQVLSDQNNLKDTDFWIKFQSVSSIAEIISSQKSAVINIHTPQMQKDICEFVLMCKEIEEKYS